MTARIPLLLAGALALGVAVVPFALAGEHDRSPTKPHVEAELPTIASLVAGNDSFETLGAALQAAGLVDTLAGEGPFTVFAPTDDAFAALPEGTVEALLAEPGRKTLTRILTYHVIAGEVASSKLLPVSEATTVSGEAVPIGLRVGRANVTTTDIRCSNGIVHVIDAVLLPPARNTSTEEARVTTTIEEAIDTGVPLFNDGDEAACARVYREAAKRMVTEMDRDLRELHVDELNRVLRMPTDDAASEAWLLRGAFDRILRDLEFTPGSEASLPEGFPAPGEIGSVVVKEYPRYRAARAEGRSAFGRLFRHIQTNDIPMTAPVEMTLDGDLRMVDMAFLYERPEQGTAGTDAGAVEVLDLQPMKVLSICVRGARTQAEVARARALLETELVRRGLTPNGPYRSLGYNSPMVPVEQRYWEVQVPIAD